MAGLILQIGLMTIEKYLTIGQMLRAGINIADNVSSTISEFRVKTVTNEEIWKSVEELNLECMIRTVESILINKNKSFEIKEQKEECDIVDISNESMDASGFIVLASNADYFKKMTPPEVVIYYLYDSINKINNLLNQIKKKEDNYKKKYIRIWNIDYTEENKLLNVWSKQLKERIELYKLSMS